MLMHAKNGNNKSRLSVAKKRTYHKTYTYSDRTEFDYKKENFSSVDVLQQQ